MDDKILKEGYHLTYENARDLINDADLLKEHERYSRAYTLFQLAIEEVGKCRLIWCAIIDYYQGKKISKKYFRDKNFFLHKAKTKSSLTSEYIAVLLFEKSRKKTLTEMKEELQNDFTNVDEINSFKNKSLYVDIEDGKFISPKSQITTKMVNQISNKAKIRFKSQDISWFGLSEMKIFANKLRELEKTPDKLNSLLQSFLSNPK